MKKYICLALIAIIAVVSFSVVGAEDKPLSIVATIFPEYDWVSNILGDNPSGIELTLLMGSGVDLHSYQPVAEDILKISTCDLFIYLGGESDEWVEDALGEAVNRDMRVINLIEALGDMAKQEETVEGMEEEEEEVDEDEIEMDEHVWLSLRNAAVLVDVISEEVQALDPDNADIYRANADGYIEKLLERYDMLRGAGSCVRARGNTHLDTRGHARGLDRGGSAGDNVCPVLRGGKN